MSVPSSAKVETIEPLPLSLLNDFLFCNRRAGLKIVEGLRRANVHTLIGDIAHEHADLPGYESQISNLKSPIILLRALPVWSDRLGLSGKCDIVEVERSPASNLRSPISDLKSRDVVALRPVEYKKSKRRHFDNDDVQLCAQALCLEEMFARPVERGAVFHAASKRRREVEFTAELRALTEQTAEEVRSLWESQISDFKFEIPALPPAVLKPQCEQCSLYEVCLPQITSRPERVKRAATALFEI